MLVSLKEAFFSGVDSCRLSHRCLGLLFPPLLDGHGGERETRVRALFRGGRSPPLLGWGAAHFCGRALLGSGLGLELLISFPHGIPQGFSFPSGPLPPPGGRSSPLRFLSSRKTHSSFLRKLVASLSSSSEGKALVYYALSVIGDFFCPGYPP